jgi:hypothetical protein
LVSMENFIVLIALAAAAAGSLILLSCMAGKRAELMQSYLVLKQQETRGRIVEKKALNKKAESEILVVSEESPDQPKQTGIATAQPAG